MVIKTSLLDGVHLCQPHKKTNTTFSEEKIKCTKNDTSHFCLMPLHIGKSKNPVNVQYLFPLSLICWFPQRRTLTLSPTCSIKTALFEPLMG